MPQPPRLVRLFHEHFPDSSEVNQSADGKHIFPVPVDIQWPIQHRMPICLHFISGYSIVEVIRHHGSSATRVTTTLCTRVPQGRFIEYLEVPRALKNSLLLIWYETGANGNGEEPTHHGSLPEPTASEIQAWHAVVTVV